MTSKSKILKNAEGTSAFTVTKSKDPEINDHPLCMAVSASLSQDAPFGKAPDELLEWETVDTQLMKRGTLSHSSIDWNEILICSVSILSKSSKYPEVLEAALLSILNQKEIKPVCAGLAALSDFLGLYPPDRHPAPQKRYIMIVERCIQGFLRFELPVGADRIYCHIFSDLMQKLSQNHWLSEAIKYDLQNFSKKVETENSVESEGSISVTQQAGQQKIVDTEATRLSATKQKLLPSDEAEIRKFRKTISELADIILTIDQNSCLAFEMRRFATWYDITSPPPLRQVDCSVISPPNLSLYDQVKKAIIDGEIDFDLILRLERMTFSTPFWLQGQFLAAQLAQKANNNQIALLIHELTYNFYNTHAWLSDYRFSDGTPFVNEETQEWLETSSSAGTDEKAFQNNDLNLLANSVAALFDSKSKEKSTFDQSFRDANEERGRCLHEIALVEALSMNGAKGAAKRQAIRIRDDVIKLTVHEWEPSVLDRLKRLI